MPIRPTLLTLLMLLAGVPAAHAPVAHAEDGQLARGRETVQSMAGCYLVDYSYVEVEALKPGYVRDPRVYDVNRDKSTKEWITAEALSPRRVRLLRVLFLSDLAGHVREDTQIRHQSEDWEYDAPYLYDFVAPLTWQVRDLRATPDLWTRRVTNLDDGLRYQCAARWSEDRAYPEWSCSNYAPIPGRETRDMGRSDYQTLQRGTRIVVYGAAQGGSWLERQNNVKTIHLDSGRVPLVRELGKNWYVRLPDAECAGARAFAERRRAYWALLRETWDGVLDGSGPFVERKPAGRPPRFVKMFEVEEDAITQDLSDPAVRQAIRERILEVIEAYRAP
ncbi:MAG: DUF6607 family protein [Candidatus Rokuibacteriota bacterium]